MTDESMYESGLAVALVLWAYTVVKRLMLPFSTREKNLRLVGSRTSWLGSAVQIGPAQSLPFRAAKFSIFFLLSFVLAFTSWVAVTWFIFMAGNRAYKRLVSPDAVKKFDWKMANQEMTVEQIVIGMATAYDLEPEALAAEVEKRRSEAGMA